MSEIVQGTVGSFEAAGRHATVLLDDGISLDVPRACVDTAGIRLLRSGQRVRLEVDGLVVTAIALMTLPFRTRPQQDPQASGHVIASPDA